MCMLLADLLVLEGCADWCKGYKHASVQFLASILLRTDEVQVGIGKKQT